MNRPGRPASQHSNRDNRMNPNPTQRKPRGKKKRHRRGPRPPQGHPGPNQQPMHQGDYPAEPFDESRPTELVTGILDIGPQGFGFLRDPLRNFRVQATDVFVGKQLIVKYRLRTGHLIVGTVQRGRHNQGKGPALLEVSSVDGDPPSETVQRPYFKDLTSIDPRERYRLELHDGDISMRLVELIAPIGRGQRGLVVAPPRTGKTILLQKMARSVAATYDDVVVVVLLVDERPEEVTDWRRNTRGEVYASSSDESSREHVRIAELVLARCQRLLEAGKHVLLLLDSLTRLGRAYNLETQHSGRTLSGGVDAKTLEKPKAIFGAARNAEEGGSLTIIATALIETGSRMDEVIFEEFKGTGNMELVLSRKLSDQRVFPAIDVNLSGTRKEEKLFDEVELAQIWKLRKVLNNVNPLEGIQILKERLASFPDNREFLMSFAG